MKMNHPDISERDFMCEIIAQMVHIEIQKCTKSIRELVKEGLVETSKLNEIMLGVYKVRATAYAIFNDFTDEVLHAGKRRKLRRRLNTFICRDNRDIGRGK